MPKKPTIHEINRLYEFQEHFIKDIRTFKGKLIHSKDGGIVEEYPQNPPHPKYLYGCPLCGSYFETDIKQDVGTI